MTGVLVIAHGSRARETETSLDAVLEMVSTKLPDTIIESAFMEFSERTVDKGISALAAAGVTEIKVVPYFLFMGIHMKEDIPALVAENAENYPGIKIKLGQHLGVDERLADILVHRIQNIT